MESLIRFVRSFWQPILVALLALVLVGQLIAWGYTALQMHSIDRLVAAAQQEKTDPKDNNPRPQNTHRRTQDHRTESSLPEPKSDIFYRKRVPYRLTAIYKNQAVIDGRPVKAGDRIEQATVVKILLSSVVIQEDGKSPREIKMFTGSGGRGGPGGPAGPRRGGSRSGRPSGAQPLAQAAPAGPVPMERPQGRMFMQRGLSREQMRELAARFRSGQLNIEDLPPEVRERAREAMARRAARRRARGQEGGAVGFRPPRIP